LSSFCYDIKKDETEAEKLIWFPSISKFLSSFSWPDEVAVSRDFEYIVTAKECKAPLKEIYLRHGDKKIYPLPPYDPYLCCVGSYVVHHIVSILDKNWSKISECVIIDDTCTVSSTTSKYIAVICEGYGYLLDKECNLLWIESGVADDLDGGVEEDTKIEISPDNKFMLIVNPRIGVGLYEIKENETKK